MEEVRFERIICKQLCVLESAILLPSPPLPHTFPASIRLMRFR